MEWGHPKRAKITPTWTTNNERELGCVQFT